MHVFTQFSEIRAFVKAAKMQGKRVGFVPTMGNLHEGHLQLVRQAKQTNDICVVSIFVNPLQFDLNEDWEQYPRTFDADVAALKGENTEVLFYPSETEMYPNGMSNQTRVFCPTMTDILCGASRPGHFEGVTTVVTKLLHIVKPHEAIFGIKDFQQLAVIRRMAEDLCMDVTISAAPIARAADGLALSSRNAFLTDDERLVANQIYTSLQWVKAQLASGENNFKQLEEAASKQIETVGMRIDYFSIRQAKTLTEAAVEDTNLVILAAAYLGNTRLIDNVTIQL